MSSSFLGSCGPAQLGSTLFVNSAFGLARLPASARGVAFCWLSGSPSQLVAAVGPALGPLLSHELAGI